MGRFIKYKRFNPYFSSEFEMQKYLDQLVIDGWEIIHYSESNAKKNTIFPDSAIILCGKINTNV